MALDGTWDCTVDTPMGKQAMRLTLATSGTTLSGKLVAPTGEAPITDGHIDGNQISWKCSITRPMPMTLEFFATIAGDSLTGNVKLGAFGQAPLLGTRV
jgi:hypothetical protein